MTPKRPRCAACNRIAGRLWHAFWHELMQPVIWPPRAVWASLKRRPK